MKAISLPNIVYTLLLILLTAAIWWPLYYAQFLEYDTNSAALFFALILSIFGTISTVAGWRSDKAFIKQNSIATILFLLSSSPVTIVLVFYNYVKIFGHLKQ